MTEGPLRVYEVELDRIEEMVQDAGPFTRWWYRWQVKGLRRDLALLREQQLAALFAAEEFDGATGLWSCGVLGPHPYHERPDDGKPCATSDRP